jgi:hypothetical protein
VVPIVYGLPGPELQKRAVRGEVALGGYVNTAGQPDHACLDCDHVWQTRRRLLDRVLKR